MFANAVAFSVISFHRSSYCIGRSMGSSRQSKVVGLLLTPPFGQNAKERRPDPYFWALGRVSLFRLIGRLSEDLA